MLGRLIEYVLQRKIIKFNRCCQNFEEAIFLWAERSNNFAWQGKCLLVEGKVCQKKISGRECWEKVCQRGISGRELLILSQFFYQEDSEHRWKNEWWNMNDEWWGMRGPDKGRYFHYYYFLRSLLALKRAGGALKRAGGVLLWRLYLTYSLLLIDLVGSQQSRGVSEDWVMCGSDDWIWGRK